MQDRSDTGQVGCRTELMQDRMQDVQMHHSSETGQVRCRTGLVKDRSDTEQVG